MKRLVFLIILGLCLSCGSKKRIVTKKDRTEKTDKTEEARKVEEEKPKEVIDRPVINSTTEYIDLFKDIAIAEMNIYGIPASITLAQGILESGSGKGRLAIKANNHFGIKCHDWTGQRIYHDDDRAQECFRKYNNAAQSFRDHSEFLAKRKRYGKLFDLKPTDYKSWARELRRAGYATDRRYPEKLISLIERYDLSQYDDKIAVVRIQEPIEHVVMEGDTLYSIAKRYNLSVETLKQLNEISGNNIKIGQILILNTDESP
ncbi:MAG: LysM peptidoglycan-binding domain-containing protein [Flavobacteriaceae bacterium]|nr:glucosaminidase domain-containing protein [Bacteroidia bacterium]NNF74480.1 LysM peptidoglycan-binding domain-containing protein [Flavobacteriaceae bacterium]NNK72529.1 LysM peptidoglycan-binding domain-containing protein [Flavobacteriaceae bacterium]